MKIAISTSSFSATDTAPIDLLKSKGCQIIFNPYRRKLNEDEIISLLDGVDGLIAGVEPLNSNVFIKAKKLRAIARVGIGLDNVDLVSAKKAGIKVSNTPDGPTKAVAEFTIAAALCLSRLIIKANNSLHQNKWSKHLGTGLIGNSVFIIGYGRIGQEVSRLLNAFDTRTMVYDPEIDNRNLKYNEKLVSFEDGLKLANIITLHANYDKPIITSKELKLMKKNVIILNSARGILIDESALISALDSKKVSSAWIDVFNNEPYNGPLIKYDQVLLTPHMSTYSIECRKDMELKAVNNLFKDLSIK